MEALMTAESEDDLTLSTLSMMSEMRGNTCFCLEVLWQRRGGHAVGAVAMLPALGVVQMGRQSSEEVRWFKKRPLGSADEEVEPLNSPRISRVQFRLQVEPTQLQIENLGRRVLRVGNREVGRCELKDGDLFELDREILLRVSRRCREIHVAARVDHEFGQPDAWGWVGESEATWAIRERITDVLANGGHVLVRGALGTGRSRLARALEAQTFVWKEGEEPPKTGNVWVANPHFWLDTEPETVELFLDRMEQADRRVLVCLDDSDEELDFRWASRCIHRVDLSGYGERRGDIPLIAAHVLQRIAQKLPKAERSLVDGKPLFSTELVRFLVTRNWTANHKELHSLLVEAVHASDTGLLRPPKESPSTEESATSLESTGPSVLTLTNCTVDLARRQVSREGQEPMALTPTEHKVLVYFSQRVGLEVTKTELLERVWEYKAGLETQAVENTVRRLRKKIEVDRRNPTHLVSVWGVGYRFEM